MVLLGIAQLAVRLIPFRYWRGTLGRLGPGIAQPTPGECRQPASADAARRLAAQVERGAARLPFATKCLPRAMALCWLLRRARIDYVFRIAARPAEARRSGGAGGPSGTGDTLHAWVESGNATVIGALPGPWLVVLTCFP